MLLRHRKPLMLHAELVDSSATGTCEGDCDARQHRTWADSRPPQFEVDAAHAIVGAMRTVRELHPGLWKNATTWGNTNGRSPQLGDIPEGFKVHIAHLGTVEALPIYQQARLPRSECDSDCDSERRYMLYMPRCRRSL